MHPEPPFSYVTAGEAMQREITDTPASVRTEARSIMLGHGQATDRVFVLLHGLSNSPAQFLRLGQALHERGHTVLIPRIPYHGETDIMTKEWARLTRWDLLDYANRAVDLAHGLGRSVTAVGLSISGTACAWLAQNRADLDRVLVMAPFLGPKGLPSWSVNPLAFLLTRAPNVFLWWDPRTKANLVRPASVYPRFPTRVIGETMTLGSMIWHQARQNPPQCPMIHVVTSACDLASNNGLTDRLVAAWKSHCRTGVENFRFTLEARVPHDFIDPAQANQRVDLVYPKLMELLDV